MEDIIADFCVAVTVAVVAALTAIAIEYFLLSVGVSRHELASDALLGALCWRLCWRSTPFGKKYKKPK